MTNIDNQAIIQYSNEYLRPLAEAVRDLQIRLDDAKVEYATNIADLLVDHADGDKLADGAPADGRSQVTKKDLADFLTQANSLVSELKADGADTLRAKFTVRPPQIG